MIPKYVYTRLIGTQALRLLVLEPGSWTDELTGTLIHVSSPEGITQVAYEAVSYTWGDISLTERITLGQATFDLPRGGCDTLRRLRLPQKQRTLWMDCVCIDQQNIQERNEQVQLMHLIFSNARKVVIYVGEEADYSHLLLDTLAQLKWPDSEMEHPLHSEACEDLQKEPLRGAMVPFLRRRWFSRIWVIQEVHCASMAELICGDRSIEWGHFRHAVWTWQNELVTLQSIDRMPPVLEKPMHNRDDVLLPLLQSARRCAASDPRDKIYAVKNMIKTSSIGEVRYGLPTDQVYLDFAIRELEASQSLRLLSYVQSTESSPSWVADWSNMSSRQIIPRTATGTFDELTTDFSTGGGPELKVLWHKFHECHTSERNTNLSKYRPRFVFASEAFISAKQSRCFELDRHTFSTTALHVKACRLGEISELYDPFEQGPTEKKARARKRRTRTRRLLRDSYSTMPENSESSSSTQVCEISSSSSSSSDGAPSYTWSRRHPPSEDDFLASRHSQLESRDTSDTVNVGLTPFLDEAQRDAAYTALRAVGLPPYASNIQFLLGRRRADVNFFPSASSSNWKARSSLVPEEAEAGDSVYFIFGTGAAFALRRVAGHDSGQAFRLIGQCYSRDIDECTLEFCEELGGEVAYFDRCGRAEGEDPLKLRKQRITLV